MTPAADWLVSDKVRETLEGCAVGKRLEFGFVTRAAVDDKLAEDVPKGTTVEVLELPDGLN